MTRPDDEVNKTAMKAICILVVCCCCLGCRTHKEPHRAAAHSRERARPHAPKLTVKQSGPAPINYQWFSTNGPDGNRVYKFTPRE